MNLTLLTLQASLEEHTTWIAIKQMKIEQSYFVFAAPVQRVVKGPVSCLLGLLMPWMMTLGELGKRATYPFSTSYAPGPGVFSEKENPAASKFEICGLSALLLVPKGFF